MELKSLRREIWSKIFILTLTVFIFSSIGFTQEAVPKRESTQEEKRLEQLEKQVKELQEEIQRIKEEGKVEETKPKTTVEVPTEVEKKEGKEYLSI